MSTLFQGPEYQAFDGNGDPLSGGSVEFFEVGTSTPKDVYSDASLSTTLGSTVTLDGEGRCKVWLNGDYKVRLKKSDGSIVRTTDGVNPATDTETSGGNLIANGSFETAGNASTDASGWTLTAQSDGSVERITADNYDGTAALKFTSDGSGGGQADTNAFFPVSPGRTYEISFALKCSKVDIRNIVQVRYFDKDQQFLSNSTVYDEAAANPTSWTVKSFTDTPPSSARFAKLRILGADQSDATAGEAKFDSVLVKLRDSSIEDKFPNVDAEVTASDEELNKLDGYSGEIPEAGWFLIESQTASSSSELDFTTGIDSTYERYKFVLHRLAAGTTEQIEMRTTSDGGSSWDSGASDYHVVRFDYSAASSVDADGDSMVIQSATSASALNGEVLLEALGGEGDVTNDYPQFVTDVRTTSDRWGGIMRRNATTAINGVRFFPSGASFDGTIYMYGWKNGA